MKAKRATTRSITWRTGYRESAKIVTACLRRGVRAVRLGAAGLPATSEGHKQSKAGNREETCGHTIDIDCRLPRDLVTSDDVRANGARHDPETCAFPLALTFGRLPLAAAAAADDPRGRNHRDTVLLIWVSEDSLHGNRIAVSLQKFLQP